MHVHPLVVIGGGVIGLSVAFELAKRNHKVTLLEKGVCGGQATGAAAGMLAPYSEVGEDPDDFFTLCHQSLLHYPQWRQEVRDVSGFDFEYNTNGSLHVVFHEADELALETRQSWQKEWNVRAQLVKGKEIRELEPHLTSEVVAALYYPDEHHLYAPDYVKALYQACRRLGVQMIEHAGEVRLIHVSEERLTFQTEQFGDIHAQTCVFAAGAWSSFFEKSLHIRLPIFPIRGQICAFEQGEERVQHMIFSSQGYVVAKRSSGIVCGASEDIAGFDTSVTEKGINRLLKWSGRLFPFFHQKQPYHRWAGLRPATQDGYPFLGRLTHLPNVMIASGHYRNGILLSPITGKCIADIYEGKQPEVPLDLFDPLRFSNESFHNWS